METGDIRVGIVKKKTVKCRCQASRALNSDNIEAYIEVKDSATSQETQPDKPDFRFALQRATTA